MTVKELKEALVGIPDNYKVVADDGMGMENGSPVDEVVIMEYYNKICMATGFEKNDDLDTVIEDPWNYEGLPEVGI